MQSINKRQLLAAAALAAVVPSRVGAAQPAALAEGAVCLCKGGIVLPADLRRDNPRHRQINISHQEGSAEDIYRILRFLCRIRPGLQSLANPFLLSPFMQRLLLLATQWYRNLELRFPFIGNSDFGLINFPYLPTELAGFLTEFRALVDSFPDRMTVGELFSGDPALAPKLSAPKHLVFDFELIRQHWSAEGFADASQKHEERFGSEAWPTIVLSNHDQSRQASRLAPDADAASSDEIARAAAVLSLTMRGTPFLYYGEEIGARDVPVPWSEIIDPPAKRGGRLVRRLVPWWNRDQARSPMPWGGGGLNGGFSSARPWLRMAPDVESRNVAMQDADPSSVLSTYRKLLWLRRRHPALQVGSYRRLRGTSRDLYAFERSTADQSIIVAVNFATKATPLRVRTGRRWKVLFDTHERATSDLVGDDQLTLAPHEAIILLAT
jgi:alpha-glucosidase